MRTVAVLMLLSGVASAQVKVKLSPEDEARVRNDPGAMTAILGAQLCIFAEVRKAAVNELQTQEDTIMAAQIKRHIRRIDKQEGNTRKTIKGTTPPGCESKAVRALVACWNGAPWAICSNPGMKRMVAFLPGEDGTFDGE